MPASYRILHVEDSPEDSELVRFALRTADFESDIVRVDTEAEFVAQLETLVPDIVLCDFDLPRFSARRALEIVNARGLDMPFILVSHHIGENAAVEAMQQGACDYLPKRDLGRLVKAVETGLERSKVRRERALAEEALQRSESLRRSILDSLIHRIALLDGDGTIVAVNKAWETFEAEATRGGGLRGALGSNYLRMLGEASGRDDTAKELAAGINSIVAGRRKLFSMEYHMGAGNGVRWYTARVMPLEGGKPGAVVSHNDVTDRVMSHIALDDANRRLQALSKRILCIQEEERRSVARELHDEVGQTLSALKIGLHRLDQGGAADQAGLISECLRSAGAALEQVRQVALDLRPPQLDELGLEDALGWLAQRQRIATGLAIECNFAGLRGQRPPPALESACYRIAQEALNNAARHAHAKNILLSVACDERLLKLVVHDDGVGFDEPATRQRALEAGRMGLIGMEERAELAGGRLKLRSVPGAGTRVNAIFPLGREPVAPDAVAGVA